MVDIIEIRIDHSSQPLAAFPCAIPSQNRRNPYTCALVGSSQRPCQLTLLSSHGRCTLWSFFGPVKRLTSPLTLRPSPASTFDACLRTASALLTNHALRPSLIRSLSTRLFASTILGANPPPHKTSPVALSHLQHSGGRILLLTRLDAEGLRDRLRLKRMETS